MTKTHVKTDDAIEAEALRLYDKYNPAPLVEVSVSKAECLRLAARKLRGRMAKAGN